MQVSLRMQAASQLTTASLDIDATSHTDRARDASLLQGFFEQERPLPVCSTPFIPGSRIQGDRVDMA